MKRISYFKKFINESNRFDNMYKPDTLTQFMEVFGQLDFQTSYNWINQFGGRDLLRSKYISNGYFLLNKLLSGDITIEEIDDATRGDHGQMDNVAFSETTICKEVIIPALEYIKTKLDADKYNL